MFSLLSLNSMLFHRKCSMKLCVSKTKQSINIGIAHRNFMKSKHCKCNYWVFLERKCPASFPPADIELRNLYLVEPHCDCRILKGRNVRSCRSCHSDKHLGETQINNIHTSLTRHASKVKKKELKLWLSFKVSMRDKIKLLDLASQWIIRNWEQLFTEA